MLTCVKPLSCRAGLGDGQDIAIAVAKMFWVLAIALVGTVCWYAVAMGC